jgi:hypothetical protein
VTSVSPVAEFAHRFRKAAVSHNGLTLTLATISPKESRVGRKMVGITVELVSIINCRTEKRYRMIAA